MIIFILLTMGIELIFLPLTVDTTVPKVQNYMYFLIRGKDYCFCLAFPYLSWSKLVLSDRYPCWCGLATVGYQILFIMQLLLNFALFLIYYFMSQVLDLHEMSQAGERLISALSLVSFISNCIQYLDFFIYIDYNYVGQFLIHPITYIFKNS